MSGKLRRQQGRREFREGGKGYTCPPLEKNTHEFKYNLNKLICKKMLANTDYKKIPIRNYYQEILQTFMLELRVFVTTSSTLLYLEVIYNIQCYISQRKNRFTNK